MWVCVKQDLNLGLLGWAYYGVYLQAVGGCIMYSYKLPWLILQNTHLHYVITCPLNSQLTMYNEGCLK